MDVTNSKQRNYFEFMSYVFKLTLIVFILLLGMMSVNFFKLSDYFPIKTVKVYGVSRSSPKEMRDILFPLVNNGFFSINVESIRDRLMQMPWVSDLYVRRIWPDQIEVTVIEKKPLAKWNQGSLLSETGELFTPKQEMNASSLPQFVGQPGQHIFMLEHFYNINRLLSPLHVKISYIELTPSFIWKVKLNNGITLQMGHKDILTRLDHFVKVYPKIVGARAADVDYIDLRYSNGMAIRWKSLNT